jgi:hypothetical protein
MTKNSDVSWIPKPVGCSLKRFTTDELVAELKTRHELCPVVDEMTREPVCLFVMTTESLVKELRKRRVVCKGCFGRRENRYQ